jgi:cell division protein FtsW (lipid II flippase)
MTWQRAGGRRFVLAVFVFCICVVLLWCGKLSDASFAQITMASVVALIAGHTVENVKANKETP